jgi:hypothetical protein
MMFLHALQRQGIEIMYSPHAAVEHRIQPQGVDSATVLRRAVEVGRVGPVMYGVCRPGLLRRFPLAWGLLRRLRLCLCHAALLRARLIRDEGTRVRRTIQPLIDLGYNREVLARARASRRKVSGPEQQPEILRVG